MTRSYLTYAAPAALLQAALMVTGCSPRDESTPDGPRMSGNDGEAVPAPVATAPVSGPERVVLALGDSLYAGYGLSRGQSLPDAIQARLRADGINARLVNAGVSGDTSADGRRRLAYTLDRLGRTPDLVLLGLGGNDVLRQLDPKVTRDNLAAMLDELRKRGVPVVLTGMLAPPNLGPDYASRFNAIFPELAKQYHAPLYPFILDGVIGNRTLMLPDGVHPNARGVVRIADRVAPVVRQALANTAEH